MLTDIKGFYDDISVKSMLVGRMEGKEKERGLDYLAYLTVRMSNGYITVKLVKCGVGLCAVVGVVGRPPEPPKFGPREPCWEVLKAFLAAPGIVKVAGATYPIRVLLAEIGYWFDRKSRVYRRSLTDAGVVTAVTPQPWRGE